MLRPLSLCLLLALPAAARALCTSDGVPQPAAKPVIREALCTLHVNGREWLDLLCTPRQIQALVYGFLANEGVIAAPGEVRSLEIADGYLGVTLQDPAIVPPPRRALTTGCGGGTTFVDVAGAFAPLQADLRVTPTQVLALMKRLHENATLYQASGGVHASGLASGDELLLVAEDVGRHNTLDKIRGACLLGGLSPRSKILLTTGRISSEMLIKAVRMAVPVLISHSSPTDLAVQLARALNVTLIGYARGSRFDVYAAEDRVRPEQPAAAWPADALRMAGSVHV